MHVHMPDCKLGFVKVMVRVCDCCGGGGGGGGGRKS